MPNCFRLQNFRRCVFTTPPGASLPHCHRLSPCFDFLHLTKSITKTWHFNLPILPINCVDRAVYNVATKRPGPWDMFPAQPFSPLEPPIRASTMKNLTEKLSANLKISLLYQPWRPFRLFGALNKNLEILTRWTQMIAMSSKWSNFKSF